MTYRPTIADRAAIRAALPFPAAFPAVALLDARRRYGEARASELLTIGAARRILASGDRAGAYQRGRALQALHDTRQYLANLRAARRALCALSVEAR